MVLEIASDNRYHLISSNSQVDSVVMDKSASKPNSPLDTKPTDVVTRRVSSQALLGAENRLWISHGKEEYQLRLTRQGKLILTK